jgi:hypothetical protein
MTDMLWHKSWLETRWRFLIGVALAICSAAATVLIYPRVLELVPLVPGNVSGPIGEQIREAAKLTRDYRGYVWSHWYRQNLPQVATLFAIILGTADLASLSRGALFALALPVSRARIAGARAATGIMELFILVFVSSFAVPILSPAIGRSYGAADTLIHSAVLFVVVCMFFALAFLLSTMFSDPWRPLLIAIAVAFVLSAISHARVMSAESYFRTGRLPWIGLLVTALISAALYAAAVINLQRRDF